MVDLRTEEEQIEMLKKWWSQSGIPTITGIAIALSLWLGWTAWQNHQVSQLELAASLFSELSAVDAASEVERFTKVSQVNAKLKEMHPESPYAIFSALKLAKYHVEKQELAEAEKLLSWAMGQIGSEKDELSLLVALRLSRIQFANADYISANRTIESIGNSGSYGAVILELKGDILLAQGDHLSALKLYSDALQKFEQSGQQERKDNLEVKLVNISHDTKSSTSTTTQSKSL